MVAQGQAQPSGFARGRSTMASRRINRLIPLDEAAWHFASPKAKDELQRESQPWSNVRTEEPKDWIDAFKKLQDMLGALIDDAVDRNEPIWKMQQHLIRRLHDGRLEAFGVRTKPEIGREPEKIPEFIFDRPKVRWKARTIENFGQRYEALGFVSMLPSRSRYNRRSRPSHLQRAARPRQRKLRRPSICLYDVA
jgi:hypothetical protein